MQPAAIVALGVTEARSVLGRVVGISKARGEPRQLPDGTTVIVTIHPSLLLRIKVAADTAREYKHLVNDLRRASKLAAALRPK